MFGRTIATLHDVAGFLLGMLIMRGVIIAICASGCTFSPVAVDTTPDAGADLQLTVTATGSGSVGSTDGLIACGAGSLHCTASYPSGSMVTLHAMAAPGASFAGFAGTDLSCSKPDTCAFSMTSARTVGANFAVNTYALTIETPSHGLVSSSDGAINCGAQCTGSYAQNTAVTLTAIPDSGHSFDSWSGGPCDNSQSPTCVITMPASTMAISASFHSNGD